MLRTIKNVWIDDNKLTLIPNCIYDMDNLENLRLSGNQITVIDDKVQNLLQLETFVIDGNKLTNLPDALTKLANLKILNVRGNLLKSIPKKINAMSSLESLHISSNQIKNLPSNFDGMEFFKELYAGSNEIENVPSSLALLESITFISLVNNNISELNEIVYQQWFDQENSKPKEFIHLKGNKVIRGSRSLSQQTPSPYFSANGKTITESAKKKKRRVRPGASCADILRNIRSIRNKTTATIKYGHVDGHTDKYLLWHQMTLEQKMNVICDREANKAVFESIECAFHQEGKQLLPGEDVAVFVRGKKLTSDLSKAIRFEAGREKAKEFLIK